MENTDVKSTDQTFQWSTMTSLIRIGVLLLLLIACFQVISPFLNVVVWGLGTAFALYPLHLKVASVLGLFVGAVVQDLGYELRMAWMEPGAASE